MEGKHSEERDDLYTIGMEAKKRRTACASDLSEYDF